MRIHYLEHASFETPGVIEAWANERGYAIKGSKLHEGEKLPALTDFDMLVSLSGPMATHEDRKHLFLSTEKELIEQAIKLKRKVLGIGLGAQLVAEALGGDIYKNPYKEIGFAETTLTKEGQASPLLSDLPKKFNAFHWHSDYFHIPLDCDRVAESKVCDNQAFSYNNHVLALQFHLETTSEIVENMLQNRSGDLTKGTYIMTADDMRKHGEKCSVLNQLMFKILDNLAAAEPTEPPKESTKKSKPKTKDDE